MKRSLVCLLLSLTVTVSLLGFYRLHASATEAQTASHSCQTTEAFCFAPLLVDTNDKLSSINQPKIATPTWLSSDTTSKAREVTYAIATKGKITADVDEFTSEVAETLNSPLGWSRLGVSFVQVKSGGDYTVWLAEASQVPSFSQSGCDATVSCTVGNNVIINQDRWLHGSTAWNASGASLRNYRNMVVNHETGHWLGHGHEYCSGDGKSAPVMQQQTISLQGCKPNPWPLASELYSPKLGINS